MKGIPWTREEIADIFWTNRRRRIMMMRAFLLKGVKPTVMWCE